MKHVVIAIAIIAAIGLVIISIRNGLVGKDESVTSAWSEVENQLQRRYDLIPNLANTVKGYARHEEKIFSEIASARAAMMGAKGPTETAAKSAGLESALGRLLAVAENYPNLKANENFIRLQDELAGTENRLAVARKRYNDSVRSLNTSIKQFPGCLFGFSSRAYFDPPAKGKMEAAPAVKFIDGDK